ncbi:MAG: MFS transporter [Candidatus Hodarchaeales archaeon]
MSFVTDIFRGHKFSIVMLYIATFIMRFAAYLAIALISYMVDATPRAFVIAFYSLTEILTVSFFGVSADRKGRKPVLIVSHLLTTIGVALFAVLGFVQGAVETKDLFIILVLYFPLMGILGAGAASKVASTMTMIADESTIETRAQYMGFFDLATLGGFGAGLATGHVLQAALEIEIGISFIIAVIIVAISLIMVYYLVDETLNSEELAKAQENEIKNSEFLTRVLQVVRTNKDLQKILPVYIPMISLYGLLVAYAKELAEDELGGGISSDLIIVAIILGTTMGASMLLSGKLSDTKLVRRPFIIIGLISLAILIIIFRLFSVEAGGEGSFAGLLTYWPITALLGFGVGMFPPAILAYLTDISKKDTRGTMFGVYSVIFGSGMIIGPLLGSLFAEIGRIYDAEIWGLVMAVVLLVLLSSIGTLFIEEKAKESIELMA